MTSRAAGRYIQERLEIGDLHEKETKLAQAQAILDGRMEMLLEINEQISKVTKKIGEGPQHLFSRGEMTGAFEPLSKWVEE